MRRSRTLLQAVQRSRFHKEGAPIEETVTHDRSSLRRRRNTLYGLVACLTMLASVLAIAAVPVAQVSAAGNGCGTDENTQFIPDSFGPFFDFRAACEFHDDCYDTKPFGNSTAGRRACDDGFRNMMMASCNLTVECFGLSQIYYLGARVKGSKSFRELPTGTVTVGPLQSLRVVNPISRGVVTVGPLQQVSVVGTVTGTVTVGTAVRVSSGSSSGSSGGTSGPVGGSPGCTKVKAECETQ